MPDEKLSPLNEKVTGMRISETKDYRDRRMLVIDDGIHGCYEVPPEEVRFFECLIKSAYRQGKRDRN